MRVLLINRSDSTGGAAIVTRRLMEALRANGVEADMLTIERLTDSPHIHTPSSPLRTKATFLAERLGIFIANGFNRDTLFKIDNARSGLPLSQHPLVREADVICLNWVNQAMLSLKEIRKIASLGKPIVWTMHDMWNFTGICHHSSGCLHYEKECGNCPLLGRRASAHDLSYRTHRRKAALYNEIKQQLHFVAVSNWLGKLARNSSLIGADGNLSVIPNAFPIPEESAQRNYRESNPEKKFRFIMGAARLDDPIKDFPCLVEATRIIRESEPELSHRIEIVTFGSIRDASLFDQIAFQHQHLGKLSGEEEIRKAYESSDAVISTSSYETLPGTLVEGLVYGCVPVAFDSGGQRDIVEDGETGVLAMRQKHPRATAAAIAAAMLKAIRLCSGPDHGKEIRERMHNRARRLFSADAMARQYIRLFETIRKNLKQ